MKYRALEYQKHENTYKLIKTRDKKESIINEFLSKQIEAHAPSFFTLIDNQINSGTTFDVSINLHNTPYILKGTATSFQKNYVTVLLQLPEQINEEEIWKATAAPPNLISEEITSCSIINTIEDAIWLRDEKGFLYINNAFKEIWGRDANTLFQNPELMITWVHPDDRGNFEHWVNIDQVALSKSYEEHFRIVKPDGTIRWLWSRQHAIYNENNKPYRIAGIASDITELKDFETALNIAKEKAQETDKLKSTFLANISHEIRTPINGIVGFSELITKVELDQKTRESYLEIIKKSSNQLLRIIDDIIDFSKIESNQIEVSIKPININELIKGLETLFKQELIKKGNTLIQIKNSCKLSDEESIIFTDEIRLKQILNNLIENAIKFTTDGSITIGYSVKEQKIEFFVEDTGIGIPKEKQEVIFDQFRQVDEGHTRQYGGTGLGLAISKGLLNLLNGSMWFESEHGSGSTFYFSIPYDIPDKTNTENTEPITHTYNWTNRIILIAEDDKMNMEVFHAMLEPTGAKLINAKTGAQAIKMCDNLSFDLILMDIRLPVINGLEATKRIKEKNSRIPIIAQTAYAYSDDKVKCLNAGCDGFITKLVRKERLLKMIDKYFS